MEQTIGSGEVGERDKKGITWDEFLHEASVECFRRGAVRNFEEFGQLTPYEYGILIDSWELKDIDEQYKTANLAWMTARAQDKKRVGKETRYVYTDFKGFFDYDGTLKKIKKKQRIRSGKEEAGNPRLKKLSQFIARQKEEEKKEKEKEKEAKEGVN